MDPEADRILKWMGWVVHVQWMLLGVHVINGGVGVYLLLYGDPWWARGTLLVTVLAIGASFLGRHYQQRLGRALDDMVRDHILREREEFLRQRIQELDDFIQRARYR